MNPTPTTPRATELSVDETTDPKYVRTAIMELRHLAMVGRHAERVLREIEEKGYYEGKALGLDSGVAAHPRGKKEHVLRTFSLKRRIEATRELAPPLGDLHVVFGQVTRGEHGGTHFEKCELSLRGTFFLQDIKGNHRLEETEAPFGYLRMKKNGTYTFEPNPSQFMASSVVPVFSQFNSPASLRATEEIARCAASWVVNADPKLPFRPQLNQLSNDMRARVHRWLIDEGHIKRLCISVREGAKVLEVMHS